ncbi:MAG: alpha/beta hydrolase [Pseudomonadota bacterium]
MNDIENALDWGDSRFISAADGLKLHVRVWGEAYKGQATPVICLPGLTRNSRDFAGFAAYMNEKNTVKRVIYGIDARGRGLSEKASSWKDYNLFTELGDVLAVLTALDIEHAIFVGTSRGGLLTMMLSAARPGAIKAAILNDVGPVLDGTGLAQIKLYLQNPAQPKSFDDATTIQKSVLGKYFGALDDDDWIYETYARYRLIKGKWQGDYDPALKHTMSSYDLDQPIPTMWPQWTGLRPVPTMVVRGENSALLSQETVRLMGEVHHKMRSITAEGQGHAPMLHKPDVARHLAVFLDELS